MARTAGSKKHYISNKEFTACISEWVLENRGKKDRSEWTVIPNYAGECFMKLVENYGHKPNFCGYTYIEDMKSEGILSCCKYAHNFNPDKSQNAFAYFTQVIHNSFLQILNREKYQSDLKYREINENSDSNYNNINLHDEEQ